MEKYFDFVDEKVKEYLGVLSSDFPNWLHEYINVPELLQQAHISVTCGTIYSDLFESEFFYSSLDHSVAVALVVWKFTHDKKQTISALYHDIATPVFKHCVDFLNGDYMTQESTEDMTTQIIKTSKSIMYLLDRDDIAIEEINDYHIYPIADNDTPKLSADRLEYSLSNAYFTYKLAGLDEIQEIYNDVGIQTNEGGELELGFKTKKIARNFVKLTSRLSVIYREDRTRYSMQFLADILKRLNEQGKISKEQLYILKEQEVISIIENSEYSEIFNIWKKAKRVIASEIKPEAVYHIKHGAKIRYIDPLFMGERMSKQCKIAKRMIDNNLAFNMDNYVYLKEIKEF